MRAGERESGQAVVDGCAGPTRGRVAFGTILAKLARVRVPVLMTGDAILGDALEHAVDVACPAFDLLVLPFEFMCRAARIKCDQDSVTSGVAGGTLLVAVEGVAWWRGPVLSLRVMAGPTIRAGRDYVWYRRSSRLSRQGRFGPAVGSMTGITSSC